MTRIFCKGTLCFAAGCGAALTLAELPGTGARIAIWLAAIALFVAAHTLRHCWNGRIASPCLLSGALLLGLAWTLSRGHAALQDSLPLAFTQNTVTVVGRIAALPERKPRYTRFVLAIERLQDSEGRWHDWHGRARLNWYRHYGQLIPGEIWKLQVRLKPPNGFANPGGFDYETWLFQRGISASGYVREQRNDHGRNRRIHKTEGFNLHRLRQDVAHMLEERAPKAHLGIIRALAIGDRSGMDTQHWDLLRTTGTAHLLAISGLHIGLVAAGAYFLARWLWSPLLPLHRFLSTRRCALLISLLAAAIYAALAGFSLPTQRALLMLIACSCGFLLGRKWPVGDTLCASLAIILLLQPFSLLAAGFWMSFCAIGIIFYLACGRTGDTRGSRWVQLLKLQFFIPLGMAPLMLYWFHTFSAGAFVANAVAIPMVSCLIAPLILGAVTLAWACPGLAAFLLWLATVALDVLLAFLELAHHVNLPETFPYPAPSLFALILALLGLAILLLPRAVPARWLGAFLLLPLLIPDVPMPQQGRFHLHLLDVGQGLAVVVRTRRHVLVYDSGDRWSDTFDAGSGVLAPFLRRQGIHKIDALLLSHGDRDHIGGTQSLLQRIPADLLITHLQLPQIALPRQSCQAGLQWEWDGVLFSVLHPPTDGNWQGNDSSCVLRITEQGDGGMSALLTGDIEKRAESRLIKHYGARLATEILIAPHHGSSTSSTVPFITAVDPHIVLFPAGFMNRFRFPKQEILERYRNLGSRMYIAGESGALWLRRTAEGEGVNVQEYRKHARRFWKRRSGFSEGAAMEQAGRLQ